MLKAINAAMDKVRARVPEEACEKYRAGWAEALKQLSDQPALWPIPKAMVRLDVSREQGQNFIDQIVSQGYEAVKDQSSGEEREFWFFRLEGVTSIGFEVIFMGEIANIGVRPS